MLASPAGKSELSAALEPRRQAVEAYLESRLPPDDPGAGERTTLHRALRYSLLSGGKRVRPVLCILAAEAAGGTIDDALPVAAAFECIHTYSLIHDDLPCMDDDDLRRGKPSSHKVFGEGMAVLAGDGLLTLAFEIIAEGVADPGRARRVVLETARAAGIAGMVGGQAIDLEAAGPDASPATPEKLEEIHRRKTQALIAAAVRTGAIAGGADDATIEALGIYGDRVGLAFQIADDLLDEEATTEDLGKTAGKDQAQSKLTYPSVFGREESRARARALVDEAKGALVPLDADTSILAALAEYIVSRKR